MTGNPLLLLVCVAFVALVVGPAVVGRTFAARQTREMLAFASATGWHDPDQTLPPEVAEAAGSPRSRLVKSKDYQGLSVWITWHQWSEPRGHRSIAVTYNLTRYYVALPRRYPNAAVHQRGRWQRGAGAGTGDADFDRAFTVSPTDEPATLGVLTPGLRAALCAGRIQPFQVAGDLLVLSYHRAPTADSLDPPLEMAAAIARLLPQ